MNRRNFFKAVSIGAATTAVEVLAGEKVISLKDHLEFPSYQNPLGNYITDPDKLIIGKNIRIDVKRKYIHLYEESTAQALYSFLKEIWKIEGEYVLHHFPMVAITPEQFEAVDGWTINQYGLRMTGIAQKNWDGNSIKEFASVILLSREGQIFHGEIDSKHDGYKVPNGECIELIDGIPEGYYYQKTEISERIPLMEHITKLTDIKKLTYQCYRIV